MSSSSQMKPEEGRREASFSQRNSCTAMSEEVTMLENPSFCEISKSLSISLDASLTISISELMIMCLVRVLFASYKPKELDVPDYVSAPHPAWLDYEAVEPFE